MGKGQTESSEAEKRPRTILGSAQYCEEIRKRIGSCNKVKQRLVDVRELSNYLGISLNTLYSWVSQRRIPFVKCGRLTKFDLERINEWIEENSVEEKQFR